MTARNAPTIDDAPGLTWKPRVRGRWEARWQAQGDVVRMGFGPKSFKLWTGEAPDEKTSKQIAEGCRLLQDKMHKYAADHRPSVAEFDGLLNTLIECYLTDPLSTFHKARHSTKTNYRYLCKRLRQDRGSTHVVDIKYRTLLEWQAAWSSEGRITMAHSMFTMLRIVIGFGAAILEREECAKVQMILRGMKIPQGSARKTWIKAEQVIALRAEAHAQGRPSIAFAKSLQFGGTFRQKDIIGEVVPLSEPGLSDVIIGNTKWMWGLRWEEVTQEETEDGIALVLAHATSKSNGKKEIIIDLLLEPMVVEELMILYPGSVTEEIVSIENEETGEYEDVTIFVPHRELLPAKGPMILSEVDGLPYIAHAFRLIWRELARNVGIPDNVFNMDTRSGAITEATDADIPLEDARHAAGHSNSQMTGRYSRNPRRKIAKSMKARVKSRKNATRKQ